MSYILDALKKADQERMAGDIPDLESVHITGHASSGIPRWVWVVLVLLVVNGILLTVLLNGDDTVRRQPVEVIATQPALPPATPAIVSQAPVAPTLDSPGPVISSVELPTMPGKPVVAAKQPKIETVRPKVEFSTKPLTPVSGVGSARPAALAQPAAEPVSPPVEIATVPSPLSTPTPVIVPEPVVMPQPTVRREAGGQKTGVPYWAELPLEYRASFELPQLDVHVYSEIPAKRFILVNLRRYREGDELPDGIDLDEILPDGLLLTYRSRQFRMRK